MTPADLRILADWTTPAPPSASAVVTMRNRAAEWEARAKLRALTPHMAWLMADMAEGLERNRTYFSRELAIVVEGWLHRFSRLGETP